MVRLDPDLFDDEAPPLSLKAIAGKIQSCRRCPIGCSGTDAVAGEGPRDAPLMIVGEQPGDIEEQEGRPLVGPAGRLLRDHLEHAGIDPAQAFLTNAVKHFKFMPRGKPRLHQTPTAGEIDICRWWLDGERGSIAPKLILPLGGSAARGILGKAVSVQRLRGAAIALNRGEL